MQLWDVCRVLLHMLQWVIWVQMTVTDIEPPQPLALPNGCCCCWHMGIMYEHTVQQLNQLKCCTQSKIYLGMRVLLLHYLLGVVLS